MVDTLPLYFERILDLLASPWAIVALLMGLLTVFLVLLVPSARWWLLSFMLWTTTFGVVMGASGGSIESGSPDDTGLIQLAFPLNIVQTNARTLSVLSLLILLLPTLFANKGRRTSLFSFGFLAYFALEMWIVFRVTMGGLATSRAVLDAIIFSMLFGSLAIGAGRWLQEPQDVRSLLKSILGFGALFVAGNVYELIRVPEMAHQIRLNGTTANAQFAGVTTACIFVPAVFLIQDKLSSRALRSCSVAIAGMAFLMLLWSGSRTSMLMAGVGVVCLFGVKQYRIILPAVGLLLVLWLGAYLFPQSVAGLDRFLDTSNDRSHAWQSMFDTFIANPILGAPSTGAGYPESFFLAALAYFGFIGGLLVLAMIIAVTVSLVGLVRQRRVLGDQAPLVNLLVAQFAMMGTAGIFESTMLGSLSITVMVIYLDFTLLAYVRDRVQQTSGLMAYSHLVEPNQLHGYPYSESNPFPDLLTH